MQSKEPGYLRHKVHPSSCDECLCPPVVTQFGWKAEGYNKKWGGMGQRYYCETHHPLSWMEGQNFVSWFLSYFS